MTTTIILVFLNIFFVCLFHFFIKKNKLIAILGLAVLFFDILLLFYRFRYRDYVLDFITFVGFYVLISFFFFVISFIILFVFSAERRERLATISSRGKRFISWLYEAITDENDRIRYLKQKSYHKTVILYKDWIFKPEIASYFFTLIPWLIFVAIFLYETWRGQGFWYSIYFSAFRILIFRIRTFLYYILQGQTFNYLSWNVSNIFDNCSIEVVAVSQDISIVHPLIYCEEALALSYEETIRRWISLYSLLHLGNLKIYAQTISDFYYNKSKKFIQKLNLLVFVIVLIGYFIKNNYPFLLEDFICFSTIAVFLLIFNFFLFDNKPGYLLNALIEKQVVLFHYNLQEVYADLIKRGVDEKDLFMTDEKIDWTFWWESKVPPTFFQQFKTFLRKSRRKCKVIFWKFW